MIQQLTPNYFDTGKAKLLFHHYAFLGQESLWAAEASECAAEQDKFWAFALYVFSHQAGENVGAFNKDKLKGFADKVGLDRKTFDPCLDSDKYAGEVQKETQEGQGRGVTGTPTFFINRQQFGLLPAAQFGQVIDSLQ